MAVRSAKGGGAGHSPLVVGSGRAQPVDQVGPEKWRAAAGAGPVGRATAPLEASTPAAATLIVGSLAFELVDSLLQQLNLKIMKLY